MICKPNGVRVSGTRWMPGVRRWYIRRQFTKHSYPVCWLLCTFLLAPLLAACEGREGANTPVPFRPPTLEAAATPLPTFPPESYVENPPVVTPAPTAAPECYNGLFFVEDLSIPDGTQVAPGAILDKRWLVQNTGTCNWNESYRLKAIAGPELAAAPEQRLFPARSGSEATIRVQFTAPVEAGTYRSAWQAYDPEDRPFGDPFFIEVVVQP